MNILQKRIQEASQKYYTDGTSNVSDAEFDKMLEQLRKEDPDSPLLGVGHGYDINKDSTVGERVKHKYGVAGSLDKCHSWEEIPKAFISSISDYYQVSLKIDGLSVVLYYREGKLVQALTRGGGEAGIDITPKVALILKENIKLKDETFTGAVRGEIVMSYSAFEQYQADHADAKNPRNTAAGIVNSKDICVQDIQMLDIVVYTIVGIEPFMSLPEPYTYTDAWKWLEYNFKNVAPHAIIPLNSNIFMIQMENLQAEWYGKYPADGIVITKDELQLQTIPNIKGYAVIYPALAFKFKAESTVTKIVGIEWNLTKTKYLVPRINVETVQLSGTNVSWATGFNAQNMRDQQLGVGAEVSIMKSGEIIPYIEDVVTPVDCELPTKCPCCGAELEWNGVHLQCPNIECADADVQDTLIWMKHIAPWDGLGDTLKLTYLNEMFGDDITIDRIYEHGPFSESELNTGLVKKTEFRKMFNALFTNQVKLCDAIQALNIPRFGDVTSRKLAEHPTIVQLAITCSKAGEICSDFSSEIGEANFQSMKANIHKFSRLLFIIDNIIWKSDKQEDKGKVAITGKLSVKRAVFEEELRNAGYTPGSIAKDTKFLITDDPNSSTDKNKKADAWGIVKITESEFRSRYM